MKKFFSLFALVACFTFLAATASDAQDVRNDTNCDFVVQITYAKIGSCTPEGSVFVTVPALSMVPVNGVPPNDYEIIEARGASSTLCQFNIGTCTPLLLSQTVVCSPPPSTSCDNYTADWIVAGSSPTGKPVIYLHN